MNTCRFVPYKIFPNRKIQKKLIFFKKSNYKYFYICRSLFFDCCSDIK